LLKKLTKLEPNLKMVTSVRGCEDGGREYGDNRLLKN
jgi:hypothetical protein